MERYPGEIADLVPLRPAGYFEDCYDEARVEEENQLAAYSVCEVVESVTKGTLRRTNLHCSVLM
jgi:hypothetical protein